MRQPDLWEEAVIRTPTRELRGMIREDSPMESQVAALRAKPRVAALQQRIISALVFYGPKTAKELEVLPELRDAGDYNVRRRCSELTKSGRLVRGATRDGAALLDLPSR